VLGLPLDSAAAMMYCQTFHGLRLVNFSGSRVPMKTLERFEGTSLYAVFSNVTASAIADSPSTPLTPETARRINAETLDLGIGVIVIHRALCSRRSEAALRQWVGNFLGWRLIRENEEFLAFARNASTPLQ
jgi:hypothetical protein